MEAGRRSSSQHLSLLDLEVIQRSRRRLGALVGRVDRVLREVVCVLPAGVAEHRREDLAVFVHVPGRQALAVE
jgi:hypothetical protein